MSLSEEEQEVIITRKTKTKALDKDTKWGNTNEDRNIPTEQGRVNPKYALKGLAVGGSKYEHHNSPPPTHFALPR